MQPRSRHNKWNSSLGAQRSSTWLHIVWPISHSRCSSADALNCYDATCLCLSAVAPVIWRRRLLLVFISLFIMLPIAFWTFHNTTFDLTSPAANMALSHNIFNKHVFAGLAELQEATLLQQHNERLQAWPCLMILSVRALSPRAAWAANVSAALPFVNRIVILLHSNWKNNFRGGKLWVPPLQLMGKNISVAHSSSEEDKYMSCSAALPNEKACIFWNAEYNVGGALPTLFRVFLRDTQKLAVAVDANRLISSAQLHVHSPSGHVNSAFSSPDIAAVGEVGAVRNALDTMRLPTTPDLHISAAMSVAADVFVPFFFNSAPQLLQVSAPLANALGEVKIIRDNDSDIADVLHMYERAAAVLQTRLSLIGGTGGVASFDSPPSNSSASLPLELQMFFLKQQLHETIHPSCLLEPDRKCRCCPAYALPPMSRAVDSLPLTFWSSPPLSHGSFFGLDLLMPVLLRSVTVDAGHTFQNALIVEVLHSLGDAWVPLHTTPHETRSPPPAVGGSSGFGGDSSAAGGNSTDHVITRFTYHLERELRDLWRMQTGAFPGLSLPVFSVQMIRFRSASASPHPFIVHDITYETAS